MQASLFLCLKSFKTLTTSHSFLLVTSDESNFYAPNGYEATVLGSPEQILTYNEFSILVYNYNISINNFGVI